MRINKENIEYAISRLVSLNRPTELEIERALVYRNNKQCVFKSTDLEGNVKELFVSDVEGYYVYTNGSLDLFTMDLDIAIDVYNGDMDANNLTSQPC